MISLKSKATLTLMLASISLSAYTAPKHKITYHITPPKHCVGKPAWILTTLEAGPDESKPMNIHSYKMPTEFDFQMDYTDMDGNYLTVLYAGASCSENTERFAITKNCMQMKLYESTQVNLTYSDETETVVCSSRQL